MNIKSSLLLTIMVVLTPLANASDCIKSEPLGNAVSLTNEYPRYDEIKKFRDSEYKKITSYHSLGTIIKKVDILEKHMSRWQEKTSSCFSTKANKYFVGKIAYAEVFGAVYITEGSLRSIPRDVRKAGLKRLEKWEYKKSSATPVEHISTPDDFYRLSSNLIKDVRAMIPSIEEQIEEYANKKVEAAEKRKSQSEEMDAKIKKEEERIAEQERIELEHKRKAAELRRLEIEREQIARKNNRSTQAQKSYATSPKAKGNGYLPKGTMICLSKSTFDRQVAMLSRGQTSLAPSCYVIPSRQNVWMKDMHMFGGYAEVERVSDGKLLFVLAEDFSRH